MHLLLLLYVVVVDDDDYDVKVLNSNAYSLQLFNSEPFEPKNQKILSFSNREITRSKDYQ